MKILTILGTRPEIIRLCRIIEKLDCLCNQIIIHTGQNYDYNLNDVFFKELGVRDPDYFLDAKGSFGDQIAIILSKMEKILLKEKPDRFLVLGDTNSSLAAIIAKRLGIPVYHMEAGNRCYDDRVPEEVNRRIIDHSSDILLPYTNRSRQNLIKEGIAGERIYVTGNPINEVINFYESKIEASNVLTKLNLKSKKYFLVTMHRQENVDVEKRLRSLIEALDLLQKEYDFPVIISTHPRTKERIKSFGLNTKNNHLRYLEHFGFFDFIQLERNAFCVLSDSGTVQEECCIMKTPNITIRDVTERPETIECGSNVLTGVESDKIQNSVRIVVNQNCDWIPPKEYLKENVSDTVVKILLGLRPQVRL